MPPDWREWHTAYDRDGPLRQRLEIVQARIGAAFDAAPAGPIRAVSIGAGQGRDLLGVLASHPRAADVTARLVELDPELAAQARAAAAAVAPAEVDVVGGVASTTSAYEGAVPADLVVACGIFGNISDADIATTIRTLPSLCAPGASVVWTRHRRPPDRTTEIRAWFAGAGFDEVAFDGSEEFPFGVGVHRLSRVPDPYRHGTRMFTFVGYDALG